MADLVSTPVVKLSTFLAMKQEAKATLTQDLNLDKAADLTAQRQAFLDNPNVPPGLKKAQLKQLNRKVAHWTKKVRQPFGEGSDVGGVGHDESAVAPAQSMIKALINTIKSPGATPAAPIRKPKRRSHARGNPSHQTRQKESQTSVGRLPRTGTEYTPLCTPRVVGPSRKAQECRVQRQATRQKVRQEKRQASGPRRR